MEQPSEQTPYTEPFYKKWYHTKESAGFVSITGWLDPAKGAMKCKVDIGRTQHDKSLASSSHAWIDAFVFGTYVRAIAQNNAEILYPAGFGKNAGDRPTPESLSVYGGSGDVSRVFRAHHWQTNENAYDSSSFVWKIGHFKGKPTSTGAIIPDMSQMLSRDSIKMTRVEIAEISYRLDHEITSALVNHRG